MASRKLGREGRTLADRLGARFDSIPLTPVDPSPSPQSAPDVNRILAVYVAMMFALIVLLIGVPLTIYAVWWNTRESLTCTVTDGYYELTHYKGNHISYTFTTNECGTLNVVDGGGMSLDDARGLGDNITFPGRYRLEVAGWEGLLNLHRDITEATRLPS